ncbi:NADPH-dependent FMN reductase [Robiginitalea myxolifaciens]|nr:NAD(P)H-dependent oxidoreductase [Robiginitalea myxolifaciens]
MSVILGFAGSNSATSINHRFVKYALKSITSEPTELIELRTLKLPIYDVDVEKASGIPGEIQAIYEKLKSSKAWVFSVNEHNGNPSAYTKSLLDWLSRKDKNFGSELKILLLSTSPGRGGAGSSRAAVASMLKRFGTENIWEFGLPSFNHTFSDEQGITDQELATDFREKLNQFLSSI